MAENPDASESGENWEAEDLTALLEKENVDLVEHEGSFFSKLRLVVAHIRFVLGALVDG